MDSGKKIDGAVALVLSDPPYMVRSEDDRVNSEHDVITQEEMVDFAELVDDVICDGCHAQIFCATCKLSKWFSAVSQMVMDVPDTSERSGKKIIEEAVFNVEKKPLVYIRSTGDYFSNPRRRRLHYMNVAENAIKCWKEADSHATGMKMVNYDDVGELISSIPMWKNVTTNVARLAAGEEFLKNRTGPETGSAGRPQQWRPGQKSLPLLRKLI